MKAAEITDLRKCVGCSLCADECPTQCISMHYNQEGFSYPEIDESRCIDCKKCQRKCPVNNVITNTAFSQKGYLALSKDGEIYQKSSSGGVFYSLAKQTLDAGGYVFGAAWDENLRLRHIQVDSERDLMHLLKSKYIQSDTCGIWRKLKKAVNSGRLVLFSGTPCQIGALRSIYPTPPDNLRIVEVICMGVPSPGLFYKYVDDLSHKLKNNIVSISFRDKRYFGSVRSQSLILRSDCGVAYARTRNTDPFFLEFLNCNTLRRSCYDCSFKSTERAADLTLGDCWGMDALAAKRLGKEVVSVILSNTPTGENMLSEIQHSIELSSIQVKDIFKCQRMLTQNCPTGDSRDTLLKYAPTDSQGTYKYMRKHAKISIVDDIKAKLCHYLFENK